jgi:prepilin-type N-terminal cleavage/methylation domain-containing protein
MKGMKGMKGFKRRAFTLTEVVISIVILGIMAASLTLSTSSSKQNAKREAERIAAVMNRLIESADRKHSRFWFIPDNNEIYIAREKDYLSTTPTEKFNFKVSSGCSFSSSPEILGYNTSENTRFSNVVIDTSKTPAVRVEVSDETKGDAKYTITVTGADSSTCYVYVFAVGLNESE